MRGVSKAFNSGHECYSNDERVFSEHDLSSYRQTYKSLERYKQQEQQNRTRRIFQRAKLRHQQSNANYKQFKAQQQAQNAPAQVAKLSKTVVDDTFSAQNSVLESNKSMVPNITSSIFDAIEVAMPKSPVPDRPFKPLMRPKERQSHQLNRSKSLISISTAREQRQTLLNQSLARIDAFFAQHFPDDSDDLKPKSPISPFSTP